MTRALALAAFTLLALHVAPIASHHIANPASIEH